MKEKNQKNKANARKENYEQRFLITKDEFILYAVMSIIIGKIQGFGIQIQCEKSLRKIDKMQVCESINIKNDFLRVF